MSSSFHIDCLGLGVVPLDFLFTVARLPEPGEKIDALRGAMQGGGPVPNALVGLSRLGLRTAVIGAIGNDPLAEITIAELKKDRVDHRFLVRKSGPSLVAIGMIEPETGRRTIVLNRKLEVRPNDLRTSRYPIPRVVHLDGRDLAACLRLAKWARRVGALVTFDIGSVRANIGEILPLVDHLVVADAFAFPYTGSRKAETAVKKLAALGPRVTVVTEGLAGSVGLQNGVLTRQPAFKAPSVDTTGAGDSFHAGYIYGLLHGMTMPERLRFGAATAALKCGRPGARAGAPTLAQTDRFLKGDPATYD